MTLFLDSCDLHDGRTYACPNDGQHCYGYVEFNIVDLGNGPNFKAFITNVYARALLGGDGEINDEFWVNQYPTTTCGDWGICWIEVGLSAGGNGHGCTLPNNETHIFWADNRPNLGFFCHDMGALQPQELNQPVFLSIAIRPLEPNSYDVEALTCQTVSGQVGCQGRSLVGLSSNNTIAANHIHMGMELAGSTGANAPGTLSSRHLSPIRGPGSASSTST